MHRSLLTTFAAVLFTAAPAMADWPLGAPELGSAPGWRNPPSVVASRHRTLAVWSDSRAWDDGWMDLLAAPVSPEGRPLETIRIAKRPSSSAFALATDGESHLVIWLDVTLRSAVMDREGGLIARDLGLKDIYPIGLTWNGRFYLAIYAVPDSGGGMVLLDRDGSIASGLLTMSFEKYPPWYLTAASSRNQWLVAGGSPERRGIVDAADFPPVGESKALDLPPARPRFNGPFAAFLGGYVSVEDPYPGRTNELAVQLYDSSGDPSGEIQRFARPGNVLGDIRLAVRDRSLYITYRTCPEPCTASYVTDVVEVRFGPNVSERSRDLGTDRKSGRSSELILLGTMSGRTPISLVGTDRGVLSFSWYWNEGGQIYSALVGSEAFRTGGTLFTTDLARQRAPRIASGSGAHLVAWVEEARAGSPNRILFTILGDDGRPISRTGTVPVELPWDWQGEPIVAADGENYLLAWRSHYSMHGIIVSRDGEILRQPFVIAESGAYSRSIVWNGVAYVVAALAQDFILVGSDGTILEPNPAKIEDFPKKHRGQPSVAYLARDGDGLLVLGVESYCPPFDAAYCYLSYEAALRRADLTSKGLESEADQRWNGRWMCCGLSKYPASQAAVAAGGGHRLVAWHEYAQSGRLVGHIAGDAGTFDFDSGDDPPRLHAVWAGSGFLVTSGPTLFRLAPTGSLLERQSLGGDVIESAVAIGRVPFVVLLRDVGVSRLFVHTLDH